MVNQFFIFLDSILKSDSSIFTSSDIFNNLRNILGNGGLIKFIKEEAAYIEKSSLKKTEKTRMLYKCISLFNNFKILYDKDFIENIIKKYPELFYGIDVKLIKDSSLRKLLKEKILIENNFSCENISLLFNTKEKIKLLFEKLNSNLRIRKNDEALYDLVLMARESFSFTAIMEALYNKGDKNIFDKFLLKLTESSVYLGKIDKKYTSKYIFNQPIKEEIYRFLAKRASTGEIESAMMFIFNFDINDVLEMIFHHNLNFSAIYFPRWFVRRNITTDFVNKLFEKNIFLNPEEDGLVSTKTILKLKGLSEDCKLFYTLRS